MSTASSVLTCTFCIPLCPSLRPLLHTVPDSGRCWLANPFTLRAFQAGSEAEAYSSARQQQQGGCASRTWSASASRAQPVWHARPSHKAGHRNQPVQ
jgi:hypothetical protein